MCQNAKHVSNTTNFYIRQVYTVDLDPLAPYEKGTTHRFSGKRIKRGLLSFDFTETDIAIGSIHVTDEGQRANVIPKILILT
jgi:hypothetical protein